MVAALPPIISVAPDVRPLMVTPLTVSLAWLSATWRVKLTAWFSVPATVVAEGVMVAPWVTAVTAMATVWVVVTEAIELLVLSEMVALTDRVMVPL